jgi:hypothetical protein
VVLFQGADDSSDRRRRRESSSVEVEFGSDDWDKEGPCVLWMSLAKIDSRQAQRSYSCRLERRARMVWDGGSRFKVGVGD